MRFLGPNARPNGLVARYQASCQREQQHQGMIGDLFGAVIGHIADDDAAAAGRPHIDIVVAHPAANDAAALRHGGKRAFADLGRMIDEEGVE